MRKHLPALGAALSAVLLALVILRNVLAGPPQIPRSDDIIKASREVRPARGQDERSPLPPPSQVAGNGIIEPADRETKVAGQTPGRIAALPVKEGDFVHAGDVLVELEGGVERAALAAAEADLAAAQADSSRVLHGNRREDVEAAQDDAEAARARAESSADSLARIEKLAKGGASTPDELDKARRQAESDKRTFDASEARRRSLAAGSRVEDIAAYSARVKASVARRDQARATLERLAVRAPIDGEILQLKARAGEYYTPGGAEPLVVLGDTRRLRARVDVDERDIARVKLGAPAFVTADAFPGQRFSGKVVEIGHRMGRKNVRTDDPTERIDTKILEVVLELDAPTGLIPGLRVVGYVSG